MKAAHQRLGRRVAPAGRPHQPQARRGEERSEARRAGIQNPGVVRRRREVGGMREVGPAMLWGNQNHTD